MSEEQLKSLLLPIGKMKALFYWAGIYLGNSPEGAKLFVSLKKRDNPDITLADLVKGHFIKSIEAYEMAKKEWDNCKPATDEEILSLFKNHLKSGDEQDYKKCFERLKKLNIAHNPDLMQVTPVQYYEKEI